MSSTLFIVPDAHKYMQVTPHRNPIDNRYERISLKKKIDTNVGVQLLLDVPGRLIAVWKLPFDEVRPSMTNIKTLRNLGPCDNAT
jgi:hypothetical protein